MNPTNPDLAVFTWESRESCSEASLLGNRGLTFHLLPKENEVTAIVTLRKVRI